MECVLSKRSPLAFCWRPSGEGVPCRWIACLSACLEGWGVSVVTRLLRLVLLRGFGVVREWLVCYGVVC